MPTLWSKASTKPDLSSTPTSSPRRDSRAASATRSKFRRARNLPTWTAPTSRRFLGIAPEKVRIIPTAVGGGFGSKLDLSVQPFVALAAWNLRPPGAHGVFANRVDCLDHEAASGAHAAARGRERATANSPRSISAADFNTGAYSSWGPTVAGRVPVHASGPYYVPNYRALTRAVHTNIVPAGAFRGFGVPQAAIAQEQLYDDLADKVGMDRLEFRILNALDMPDANRDRAGARRRRRHSRLLRGLAAAMADPRACGRLSSTRKRMAVCGAELVLLGCGTDAATPRCRILPPCASD